MTRFLKVGDKVKKFISSLIIVFTFFALHGQSNEKFRGWKKAETKHFNFFYEDSAKETAEEYGKIADNAWNKIARIYSFPKNKMNIYVTDRTNTVNAFTYSAPTEIVMFTTPPVINDFGFRTEWKELFFTHELIHAANFQFEDKNKFSRKLFGPIATSMDFMNVPKWALEGLTTVLETELTEGGRGRSPYFELEFKAPALENSLISYKDIGKDIEPPVGQSYIMGYLIMRSIADRWGIQALADIERNRNMSISWEQSIKLVTGYTPDEIYRDAKIALTKKYAQERNISEGITISSRTVNTNYSKPAIIFDDGSLIALRTASGRRSAVVKLNPALKSGSNYIEKIRPEKNINTVFDETILFEGYFPEKACITADTNGNVYASMGKNVNHKLPGYAVDYDLYKWNETDGLKQITKGSSYFQPSVSRDGKVLIAIKQKGLSYALVKIDVETGVESIVLEDSKLSFIQPAVNDDGSKVAFLMTGQNRAAVGICDLENPENYRLVYNAEGEITDPSYPHWNSDGKLIFTDNQRGRLESFVYDEEKIFPAVADPVGVLWAYQNEKGIYYSTFSGTGYVLKIKPSEEWGNVPDFMGPSMPGQIMTFGTLENDYPDFKPYTKLCEVEVTEKNDNKNEANVIRGKVVKHRSEENKKKAAEILDSGEKLGAEKIYVPFPKPVAFLPELDILNNNDNAYFGYGAMMILESPRLQMSTGIGFFDAVYFPQINNFSTRAFYYGNLGTGIISTNLSRNITNVQILNNNMFAEQNNASLAYSLPIYSVDDNRTAAGFYAVSSINFMAANYDSNPFSAFSKSNYELTLTGNAGLEFYWSKIKTSKQKNLASSLLALGLYDINSGNFYAGLEGDISYQKSSILSGLGYDINLGIRYTDYPATTFVADSLVKFNGISLDSTYPGRAVYSLGLDWNILQTGIFARIYEQGLMNFGSNTKGFNTPQSNLPLNITFGSEYATGFEITYKSNAISYATGYSFITNFQDDSFIKGNFYFTVKMTGLRF